MKRRFNQTERLLLRGLSGNRCTNCQASLSDFHADHIHPFVRGGETSIQNGQALCPKCNLRKGSRMTNLPAWPMNEKGKLRDWQQRCWKTLKERIDNQGSSFLCVACPAAGKTRFSSYVMHQMLSASDANYIIIVCPSEHLTTQWARDASLYGIHLGVKPDKDGSILIMPEDMHGMVVTYQAIAANTKAFQIACKQKRVLFIGDEIHHAGNNLAWGQSLKIAFENARFKLLLSGTPFRSDNREIPFVNYELCEDGFLRSKPDFTYGYGDGLLHQTVVRPIWFPTYEADAEWMSNGKRRRASFGDELEAREASELLRTVLRSKGWLAEVLRDANAKLTHLRSVGHANAGALIICIDKEHAKQIAAVLHSLGEQSVIVTSDDAYASALINEFRDGSQRWLVAVRMVSEGVDIKRLRVGVYATNILTEMYFRQVVGRFVRHDDSLTVEDQSASLYLPKNTRLYEFAQVIREEREHVLRQMMNDILTLSEPFLTPNSPPLNAFTALSAQALEDVVIGHDILVDPALRPQAEQIRAKLGLCDSWEKIAAILQSAGAIPEAKTMDEKPEELRDHQKKKLRGIINSLCGSVAFQWQREQQNSFIEIKDVHAYYIRICGKRQSEMTLEELKAKIKWLESELSRLSDE